MSFISKLSTALGLMVALSNYGNAAECNSRGFNTTSSWCNGCTYEGSMIVQRDQPCERPYRPNLGSSASAQVIEFFDNRIIKRAQHGIAGVEGNTLAYAPAKGYVGSDEFIVLMNYRQGKEVGKFQVHFSVTVQ